MQPLTKRKNCSNKTATVKHTPPIVSPNITLSASAQQTLHMLSLENGYSQVIADRLRENVVFTGNINTCWAYSDARAIWTVMQTKFLETQVSDMLQGALCEAVASVSELPHNHAYRQIWLQHLQTEVNKQIRQAGMCARVWKAAMQALTDVNFLSIFNHNEHQLPIAGNLVVDLTCGKVRPRVRDDSWNHCLKVSFLGMKAPLPHAEEFFSKLMLGNLQLISYLQKILGYCLTGRTDARKVFVFWGLGSNGKSTVLKILEKITKNSQMMSAIAKDLVFECPAARAGTHNSPMKTLEHSRIAVYSEADTGNHFNEAMIKWISSNGDTCMFREAYSATPRSITTHAKLILLTNWPVNFTVTDQAMLDRLVIVPFNARFVDENPGQGEYLRGDVNMDQWIDQHLDELFTWMVRGAVESWKHDTCLSMPTEIKKAREQYIQQLNY